MKKALSLFLALCAVVACLSFAGCGKEEAKGGKATAEDAGGSKTSAVEGATKFVRIDVKDYGSIVVELYPDIAPITVENFQKLVAQGFYDGLTFHRVISGFMIQGGCPNGNGSGGPGWTIKGEFSANGVKNDLKHTRGVISMARQGNPYNDAPYRDTAGSQFFIMHQDYPSLDGQYAAFGKVVSGIEVVDKIAAVKTNPSNNKPLTDVVMEKVYFVEGA